MSAVNSLTVRARRVVGPDAVFEDTIVEVAEGRIRRVLPATAFSGRVDSAGEFLIPGMIDLHVNGAGGGDAAEGTEEALEKMSRNQAAHGTTGFLATIVTNHADRLVRSLERLGESTGRRFPGARPLGIHLEGPFINPKKRGAHREECIQKPSEQAFRRFEAAAGGKLKMITLAPEAEGALELIRQARETLPVVSLGHTDADYETTLRALEAGANLATHVYNAMPSLHHREPSLLGAVLESDLPAEIIADGIHVHPAVLRLTARAKGPRGLILVTDAIAAAGMPDGDYTIGDIRVTVTEGVCRDAEGRLAGSTLTMDRGLRNLRDWTESLPDFTPEKVVAMATRLPAALLGLADKGRIEPGCDADLVLMNDRGEVVKTWVEGDLVYDAEGN